MKGGKKLKSSKLQNFKSLMEMTTMSIFYLFISMTFIATYKKEKTFVQYCLNIFGTQYTERK